MVLDAERSASVRDRLLAEIGNISSTELAASWAHTALSAKNTLTASDANVVEGAFEQRLFGSSCETTTSPGGDGTKLTRQSSAP
jgi:hypothetical protein